MSLDQLRGLLAYPDDDVLPLDLSTIVERADRRHRSRQALIAAAAAASASALVGLTVLFGGPAARPGPGAASTASPPVEASPASSLTSTSPAIRIPSSPAQVAKAGERVAMGQGWTVQTQGTSVCVESPNDQGVGTFMPFGCRSTTDGNIGGMGVQSAGGATGTMYSAVIPWDVARVDVDALGQIRPAALVQFTNIPGWTFYYLWVPGPSAGVTIVAYDSHAAELGRVTGR